MKKLLLSFACIAFILSSFAQASSYPSILRWLDDQHYLESKKDADGKSKIYKVNAKTGEYAELSAVTYRDEVNNALPEGFKIDRYTESTTDYNSTAYIKDKDLYYYSRLNKKFRQLTDNPGQEQNPGFSPDENRVAYTKDGNLFYIDLDSGLEHQLTTDGTDLIYNGWSSWVYMEEILGRYTRHKAYWWSPDSKKIAFLRFDDRKVLEFPIFRHKGLRGELERTRYPKVGDTNPGVKLGIIDLETKKITWVDCNCDEDKYVAFPFWTPDSKNVIYQVLNREQDDLKIYVADAVKGDKKEIYREQQSTWVEFFSDLYALNDGFVIRSDKSGWRNLYHFDFEGKLINQITKFEWRVTAINNIDEDNGIVYFTGTGESSTENHLFSIKLNGKGFKQLSKKEGTHRFMISPNNKYFIDSYSNWTTPSTRELYTMKGSLVRELGSRKGADASKPMGEVKYFTITHPDGFDMPAYMVLPVDFDPNKKYPVVFQIYGGPDSKNVRNRYISPQGHYMTNNGIIRFAVDHRGSGHFGKKRMGEIHRVLGKYDLADYTYAAKWLIEQGYVDETKIGMTGGSYGGYMAALALTKGADTFTHGWSAFPVTDWRLYDNVYTERYMDDYKTNKEGYDQGNVMLFAENLKGKLWLIHGTMDDNVHMQNTIQLVDRLLDLDKDFDFMLYPGERHGWRSIKAKHSSRLQKEFWLKEFGN
ncbi:MAG: peptidase [Bacteroidetes bacterium]|nr:peptidase [Bacteroidota bacterium]